MSLLSPVSPFESLLSPCLSFSFREMSLLSARDDRRDQGLIHRLSNTQTHTHTHSHTHTQQSKVLLAKSDTIMSCLDPVIHPIAPSLSLIFYVCPSICANACMDVYAHVFMMHVCALVCKHESMCHMRRRIHVSNEEKDTCALVCKHVRMSYEEDDTCMYVLWYASMYACI